MKETIEEAIAILSNGLDYRGKPIDHSWRLGRLEEHARRALEVLAHAKAEPEAKACTHANWHDSNHAGRICDDCGEEIAYSEAGDERGNQSCGETTMSSPTLVPPLPPDRGWRVGRSVGRTLYLDGKLVGMMDTPELAAQVIVALRKLTEGSKANE